MTTVAFRTEGEVAAAIPRAVAHLRMGGLLAYPTETVYGLGSRAHTTDMTRLVALKGRAAHKPFLLLVSGRAMLEAYGLLLNSAAEALADRHWPGPLTLVLPGGEGHLPDALRGPEGGIAARWTSHQGIARLLAVLGEPLTSTSANHAGEPTASGASEVEQVFGPAIDRGELLLLDGGVLATATPSTIVDCTGSAPRLLREGAISRAELGLFRGTSA